MSGIRGATIVCGLAILLDVSMAFGQVPGAAQGRFMPPQPPPTTAIPVSLGLQTRVTDTGVVVVGHGVVSVGKTIGIERGDTIITIDGQQVGQVANRVIDVDLTLQAALSRGNAAVILLRNGRDGRLLNAVVRREQFVVMQPPVVMPGPPPLPPGQLVQVKKWYLQFLGREATPQEVGTRENELRQGRDIEAILSELLATREYYQRNGNDEAKFVGALFRDLLKRNPVHPEGQNWLTRLKEIRGDRNRFVDMFRSHYKV